MKKLFVALVIMAAFGAPTPGQTIIGNEIHDFSLPDLNGTFRSPIQYRGKILGIFLLGYD
ncbi:MAG: hypothetical protein VX910_02990 [Candidatus Latescibacterota bacterium]|nr:hypothetical protein [Candidatus Latescibacterota bacterium]